MKTRAAVDFEAKNPLELLEIELEGPQVGEVLVGASGAKAVVRQRRLVTDRLGQWKGSFFIPPPQVNTNPRWATGSRLLRLTTNADDSRTFGTVASAAQTEYAATSVDKPSCLDLSTILNRLSIKCSTQSS